jgi:hypothetical protein
VKQPRGEPILQVERQDFKGRVFAHLPKATQRDSHAGFGILVLSHHMTAWLSRFSTDLVIIRTQKKIIKD